MLPLLVPQFDEFHCVIKYESFLWNIVVPVALHMPLVARDNHLRIPRSHATGDAVRLYCLTPQQVPILSDVDELRPMILRCITCKDHTFSKKPESFQVVDDRLLKAMLVPLRSLNCPISQLRTKERFRQSIVLHSTNVTKVSEP